MAILLHLGNLIDAAEELNEIGRIPNAQMASLVRIAEAAVREIGQTLADVEGVRFVSAVLDRHGGGLYAEFAPGPHGRRSAVLQRHDGGDEDGAEWGEG